MQEELQDIFPKIKPKQIWKLLITIKARIKKYNVIWLSRLEAIRFWLSERQMQSFIYYLRNVWAINKKWMVKGWNNCFKCNVYSLSEWFLEEINKIKDFVVKKFEYIEPLEYMLARFNPVKHKYWKYHFIVNWNRYIINERGKYKWKIYWCEENKLINPLLLW